MLADALAAGASIVTPNNRLARDVAMRFDASQRAAGKRAWMPAAAFPWTTWLERLWLAALAARAATARAVLDPAIARELWHSVVAADRPRLVDARGAARHAADAWTTFHAWRRGAESLQQIVARGAGDDAQCFLTWADAYARRLDGAGSIDHAQLPDVLAACAAHSWTAPLGRVLLHGFVSFTPQQRRLIGALQAAGMAIEEARDADAPASIRYRKGCATPSLELAQALAFARARVEADSQARVAIVVLNLDERRDEAIALAEEILCPERLMSLPPDAPRPYGVSLGEPLANVPLVACALGLIALATGDVDATAAASALRAPFLPDAAAQWPRRAEIERRWRDEGRRTVGWPEVLHALRRHDPLLHERAAALRPLRGKHAPREWAGLWSDWLAAIGWPGDATLTSAQWQARDAWSNALAKFATSGVIAGPVTATAALQSLRALLADTRWSPEAAPAQIQILGVLEAAGLSFDFAWLAGFDAQRWPPAATPNPFLPLDWQRARGVIRADPDTALAHARQLSLQLVAIAREVVASHAEQIDDAPSSISPLFADWPQLDDAMLHLRARLSDAMAAADLEHADDDVAPPLAGGAAPARSGVGLFESQSACPFQAFARYRLRANAWDECPEGLSAKERGIVLHAVLKAFWDGLPDQAALLRLDAGDLVHRIAAAVEAGKAQLDLARWRALPPAIAAAETRRLAATLRGWIDEIERSRPPFRVRAHEARVEFDLEGIAVNARIDRIDELDSGGLAIIDYKSGAVVKPVRWFAARPEGLQLAVYARGVDAAADEPVRALAYAQLKAGEIGVRGVVESQAAWPALEVAGDKSRLPVASFEEARARMNESLDALAREIRDGVARVAPRDRTTCQYCGLHALCRIRRLDDDADATAGAARDE